MAKFFLTPLLIFVVLGLVAICSAEPQRRFITNTNSRRNGAIRSNLRFLARQEAAAPEAAAPYPAAGVTPETPFDLPTETEAAPVQPDQTYGPPDSTYGPPAAEEPLSQPDDTYGPPPPEAADGGEDVEAPPADDAASGSNGSDAVSQNLIQPRFRSLGGRLRASPARLRAAPIQRRRGNVVEVFRSEPLIVYALE